MSGSVRCDWRGIARTAQQRTETLRLFFDLAEDSPLPPAAEMETLSRALGSSSALPSFHDPRARRIVHRLHVPRLLRRLPGPGVPAGRRPFHRDSRLRPPEARRTPTRPTRRLTRTASSPACGCKTRQRTRSNSGRRHRRQRQSSTGSSGDGRAWCSWRPWARTRPSRCRPGKPSHSGTCKLRMAGGWTRCGTGRRGTTPNTANPLDRLRARVSAAGATDAFAGERIVGIDGLRAYYESIGAYGVIGPYNVPVSERAPFAPSPPPPPRERAGADAEPSPGPAPEGTPTPAPYTGPAFTSISSGGDLTCGLEADGAVLCWGGGKYKRTSPPRAERFESVSAGRDYGCGLRADGTIGCWGGELPRWVVAPPTAVSRW